MDPDDALAPELARLANDLSTMRLWGQLLGEAKKAIESWSIDLGFASATGIPSTTGRTGGTGDLISQDQPITGRVQNPDVVLYSGKGRPTGTTRVVKPRFDRSNARSRNPLAPIVGPNGGAVQRNAGEGAAGEALPGGEGAECGDQEPATNGEGRPAKRPKKCGVCGQMGFHNARTCPQR